MELRTESNPAFNTVTAFGRDYIEINEVPYGHAVYFGPTGEIKPWAVQTVADISASLLRDVAGLGAVTTDPLAFLDADAAEQKPADAPEVILIGTGLKQHFLPPHVTQSLLALGIGVESMSTQAAARTYNILMSEGRHVIAALLPYEDATL
ncbi:Mth938-like domain-containing protein [Paralcaligenes ureilyticus]|uniref:Xcc1710-like domain-containing protein n=1 Tax=Paralcaligenes ureilyticus TaxID=627131 RepID=A0A4R3M186_9BURK|nr:Mth938-like domain-containing protein [Paralcaligenes ureilyticus]TCT04865.1 uncharacterized protein EDC26_11182 [Paralcaligenes ureilyticus]